MMIYSWLLLSTDKVNTTIHYNKRHRITTAKLKSSSSNYFVAMKNMCTKNTKLETRLKLDEELT